MSSGCQEKVDVNAAASYIGGRAALEAALEGGNLAVVERLHGEMLDSNCHSWEYFPVP